MGLLDFLQGLFGSSDDETPDRSGSSSADDRPRAEDDDDGETKDVSQFGPAEFREEAESFAADHEDRDLDFTLASLERLDEFAVGQTELLDTLGGEMGEDNELVGGMREGYALWWGSYFGEVLVRAFDGEWRTGGDAVTVVVSDGDEELEVPPIDVAVDAVTDEPRFASIGEAVRLGVEESDSLSDVQAAFDQAGGGSAHAGDEAEAVEGDLERPTVELEPGMDLDAAHERAVEIYEAAGFHVSRGDLMNSVGGPTEGIAKLFNFHTADEIHTGVVYPGEWDTEATNAVLTLASSLRDAPDADGLHVIAANEPPDVLQYVTGTHPRGAFALAAMVAVQNGQTFDARSLPEYADEGRELLESHFGLRVDEQGRAALERLDEFVVEELRTVERPEADQGGFVPQEALMLVGAVAGEVMAATLEAEHPVTTRWTNDEEISSTGVALAVEHRDSGDTMTVNPVGKAFKLFESGTGDSIAFMYDTCSRVTQEDLA